MLCSRAMFRISWYILRKQSNIACCSKEPLEIPGTSDLVTAVNSITKEHSVVQIRLRNESCASRTCFSLPKEAIDGLKNALLSCSRNVKQLQHEADQLNEKLANRKFPAPHAIIKEARVQVQKKLLSEDTSKCDERFGDKIKNAKLDTLRREISKYLRRSYFNWKPLSFENRESVAVYFLARLQSNYAEVSRVLQEFRRVGFFPKSVLDYGSGSCSVFWATNELWGNKVEEYQCVDPCDEMNKFAMDVLRGSDDNGKNVFVHPNVNFRRYLPPSLSHTYDLVVAHRVFIELTSHESRLELMSALWARTNRFLVLIDSSAEGSFDALVSLRDYIVEGGHEIHANELKDMLSSHGSLDEETESIIHDKKLTSFERYALLRERIPAELSLPTRVQPGFTFAPCSHDQGCPKLASEQKNCKFSVRWSDLRADGKLLKSSDGTASGTFSYFILEKGLRRPKESFPRILKSVRSGKQVFFQLCTPFNGLQHIVLSKKDGKLYKNLKDRKVGELLPVEATTVSSESAYDLFREAVEEFGKSKTKG